jgi:hypothetical protein
VGRSVAKAKGFEFFNLEYGEQAGIINHDACLGGTPNPIFAADRAPFFHVKTETLQTQFQSDFSSIRRGKAA